jgi:hypothetical protein
VVHVFVEELRAYYDLDRLWADAPRLAAPGANESPAPVVVAMADARPRVLAQRRRFMQ